MFERQSALAGALTMSGRDGCDGRRLLRLGERHGAELVQVAAFASTLDRLRGVLRPLLDAELPPCVGESVAARGGRVFKVGPEHFWIVSTRGDIPAALQAAVPAALGAVTLLSHGRACIFVEGAAARQLLAGSVALDLHPDVMRVDHFALTALHGTPVLLHRAGESRYELHVMRSCALSVWDWLADAAMPFGFDVVAERAGALR